MTRSALLLALLAACSVQGTFECGYDEACRRGDEQGTCELDGRCSFADGACESGRRYASNAGDVAETCVRVDLDPRPCIERWLDDSVRIGPVSALGVNTAADERDPWLSGDGTTLVFSSNRPGTVLAHDLYIATRADTTSPFTAAERMDALSSTNDDSHVTFSTDQLSVFLASDRAGGRGLNDIWRSTRVTPSAAFGAVDGALLGNVNTTQDERDPALSADGLQLYLSLGAGTTQTIAMAARGSTAVAFAAPQPLTVLASTEANADPAISSDGRLLLFTSRRPAEKPGGNLWYTTRATTADPWTAPRLVPDINTELDDGDAFLSADTCTVTFARPPVVGATAFDLYSARLR